MCSSDLLGRTHESALSPELNGENLIVVLAPLVFVFGAGIFSMLLDQLEIGFPPLRKVAVGIFVAVCSLPMIFTFAGPRKSPLSYPPYFPPMIRDAAGWMQPGELMLSDMPWAVAWYGRRECAWLTWDVARDFAALHAQGPVRGLYLTALTMDGKLLSQLLKGEESAWGRFAVDSVVKGEMPDGFPLKHGFSGWLPDQLFLSDRPRWQASGK
mgnify:CR=1 FL=1